MATVAMKQEYFGFESRIWNLPDRRGLAEACGEVVGVMIDGARDMIRRAKMFSGKPQLAWLLTLKCL